MIDIISDLDGVIYRGDQVLPGTGKALSALIDAGGRITYVTNNSTRTPEEAAEKIQRLTGVPTDPKQVATSAVAAAHLLSMDDSPAFVVGEPAISAALAEVGVETTDEAKDASSVVVGMFRGISYSIIAEAADAIRSGCRFVATNTDPTFPTATGLLPGSGAIVAAIAAAAGKKPEVAGKPHAPMRRLLSERGIETAWVVGDRLDTDIAMATVEPLWRSILVLTGVTARNVDLSAADFVVDDFAAAVNVVLDSAPRS